MGVLVGANGFSFRIYVSFSYLTMFLSSSSRLIQIRGSPAQAWSGYIWRFFALFFFAKREDCDAMPCHAEHDRYHDVLPLCAMAVHVAQRKDRF
jgi:hypothetical protein